jgi:protein-L-isoaspartate(D-aspartate) O-methyltransferase
MYRSCKEKDSYPGHKNIRFCGFFCNSNGIFIFRVYLKNMSWITFPEDRARELKKLVKKEEKLGVLKTPRIIDAFLSVDRAEFVPEDLKVFAYADEPQPLPGGQTISQPYTVAFMLELLSPKEDNRIMDVGYGSGWSSALLAYIVGEKGHVHALEIVPELCLFGKMNVEKFPELFSRIDFYCKSATDGLLKVGGFDGIISAAALESVPKAWREQLKTGGRIVYPLGDSLWLEVKQKDGSFEKKEYPGFVFVPYK